MNTTTSTGHVVVVDLLTNELDSNRERNVNTRRIKNILKILKLKNKQSPNSVPDDEPPFTIDIKRLRFEEDDVNDNNSFRLRVLHLILQYKIIRYDDDY
ncbi:hypothetical protein DERF_004505 [Dermatophagoides farinae]|uniref:Uncharacterized protein n=1 Tax=Dermatophagoides farinae TaxID=6954 RepID=A0A922I3E4_DERFA|nr:hypothetical protein DERF_004505 [Dermatophagoides farinae]